MPVAYDSTSSAGPTSSVSSINWAHTLGAGTNLVAIVAVSAAGGTLRTVSSVTYGAQSMSQVPSSRILTSNGNSFVELWSLIAPSGNQTVTITLSGSQSVVAGGIIVVSGADQTAPLETASTSSGSTAALSVSPACTTNEMAVGAGFDDFNGGASWAISTGTGRFTVGSGSGLIGLVGGTQTGSGPTVTFTFTESAGVTNSPKAASAVAIKEFTAASGLPPGQEIGLGTGDSSSQSAMMR